jgi:hypothetical protein
MNTKFWLGSRKGDGRVELTWALGSAMSVNYKGL